MNALRQLSSWLAAGPTRNAPQVHNYAKPLLASLMTMAWFVEARDPYTGGHLWRVSKYAQQLAEKTGLGTIESARISLGGFLHDIGKIGIPDAILRKPGKLTDEEYALICTHPDLGRRMLAGHPLSKLVQDAIHLHHERPDGLGYPLRLKAHEIPVMARIVGLCDAFDAMTSHRPYRAGMPLSAALAIIKAGQGNQFAAEFVDDFLIMGKSGELNHVLGHSDDGIPLQTCPMCGPTLVLRREQEAGQRIYCRNCGGEFKLVKNKCGLTAQPTGLQGAAKDLEPELDGMLIERTVLDAVNKLPASDLLIASHV